MDSGFNMQESMPDGFGAAIPYIPGVEGLNYFKAEDAKHFSKLMDDTDVFDLSTEEVMFWIRVRWRSHVFPFYFNSRSDYVSQATIR
jgi:hypothetical protein